jgi:hypothetical protein
VGWTTTQTDESRHPTLAWTLTSERSITLPPSAGLMVFSVHSASVFVLQENAGIIMPATRTVAIFVEKGFFLKEPESFRFVSQRGPKVRLRFALPMSMSLIPFHR